MSSSLLSRSLILACKRTKVNMWICIPSICNFSISAKRWRIIKKLKGYMTIYGSYRIWINSMIFQPTKNSNINLNTPHISKAFILIWPRLWKDQGHYLIFKHFKNHSSQASKRSLVKEKSLDGIKTFKLTKIICNSANIVKNFT